ncbi:MAG: prenyltransferase [Anaerolineae bacterium]|nr:prenyltransferase [Anaerolineae bacterium]
MASVLRDLIAPLRPPFLMVPPSSVALGAGAALWLGHDINLFYLLLALVGATAAHGSVNALNCYMDFRSGLDARTNPTPFSGMIPMLRQRPERVSFALISGVGALTISALVGIYFLTVWGWGLLPLGLLGIFLIVAYTPWITRLPAISLIAPGLGIGMFMVNGTYFVLTGSYSWTAFFASLVPFWLISELLVINQFPDVEPDESVGRRNYVILLGRKRASRIYAVMLWATYVSILVGWVLGHLPVGALLGLLTTPWAVQTTRDAYRHADDIEGLLPVLAKNVQVCVLTPALTALGILLSVWLS